jgi:signal transduction histidine kinase
MQEAITTEREVSLLHENFLLARIWERTILLQENPEAEMKFGERIKQIKDSLQILKNNDSAFFIQKKIQSILENLAHYENDFNKIIQLKTEQRLHTTRMETSYLSLSSYVLRKNQEDLLKPLFNFTRFRNNYHMERRESEYQALLLVASSLETKLALSEPHSEGRALGYVKSFVQLLHDDFQLENEVRVINKRFQETSNKLSELHTEIFKKSKELLRNEFFKVKKNRQRLNHFSLIFFVISLITLTTVLMLILKKIITPIRSVAGVMTEVKTGNIEARYSGSGNQNDELEAFCLYFNSMLDTLQSNNTKLLEYQSELEKKVKDIEQRSVALARANESLEKGITERKIIESERNKLASQLQRAEKMEALGVLAGGVAHDLNNVLSGIVGFPDLLLSDMPEDHPLRKPLETIYQSGVRAANIVQDLLSLARRGVAETFVINLNNICSEYLRSLEHRKLELDHPGVKVETQLETGLLNLIGSPAHIEKTLMNLILNAAEAMPHGGVISIKTENVYVDTPIQGYESITEGDYVTLSVSDTGIGLSPEDLGRIFEPFYTKKIMGRSGTGLGMAVVWGTVKDHKGYVDIQSVEDKGTTVTLYFPASREELRIESQKLTIENYMGNGEKILIVDDVEEQRLIASSMLKKLAYSVATVSSGEEAVEYIKENSADLIVLDMIMDPGIDGLDTYKQILEIVPGQKAIITSGYSETDRVREAQQLGAKEYIRKPYTLEKIGIILMKGLRK